MNEKSFAVILKEEYYKTNEEYKENRADEYSDTFDGYRFMYDGTEQTLLEDMQKPLIKIIDTYYLYAPIRFVKPSDIIEARETKEPTTRQLAYLEMFEEMVHRIKQK